MDELELEAKARQLKRDYIKAWRKKNKDKVALYNISYWQNKVKALEKKGEINV